MPRPGRRSTSDWPLQLETLARGVGSACLELTPRLLQRFVQVGKNLPDVSVGVTIVAAITQVSDQLDRLRSLADARFSKLLELFMTTVGTRHRTRSRMIREPGTEQCT